MDFVTPDFLMALPEIYLMGMICAVLVVDVFLDDARRHITYGLSQATLLVGVLVVLWTAAGEPAGNFNGHYIRDLMGDVLKVGVLLLTAAVFLYARDFMAERGLLKGELFTLGLFGVLGMFIMISAHSLLTVYLGLELLSLSLYAMVAIDRDSPTGSEAAMKYFVLGALASGMLLYGISMIYGATGSVELAVVGPAVAAMGADNLVLVFGLVFLVVGLSFKLGAVPFHMWLPDVYQGAPTPVTLYIGAAPKLAAFALVMRVLVEGMGSLHADWQAMLVILTVLSLAIGNVVAIAQTSIKRMLAYSTISHVGFILMGVLAGTAEGYAAAMFYALTYTLMVAAAFGIILVLNRRGAEYDHIESFRGLNQRNAWLALLMLMVMMSMAGIPVLVGFWAKLYVLEAAVRAGLTWLAVLALVFSVIGAFYYLRVVKFMYFDAAEDERTIVAELDTRTVLGANGLLILALGLYPTALLGLCLAAVQTL